MAATKIYVGKMLGTPDAEVPAGRSGGINGYERIKGQVTALAMTQSGANFPTTSVLPVDGYERNEGGIA